MSATVDPVIPPASASEPFHITPASRWRCVFTIIKREVLRFWSVSAQTLVAPVISTSLYLFIFGLSLGTRVSIIEGFTYVQYIVPGLVLMVVLNNSFANTSSSLFMAKYMGYIQDLLVSPLTPLQMILGYTTAALLRGIIVGCAVLGISLCFTTLPFAHPFEAACFVVVASFLFSQFGLLAAMLAVNFDTLSMFTNFLILPLIYLGGLFYPVSQLPGVWKHIASINPVYYLIEGFRHSMLGVGDIPIATSLGFSAAAACVLCFCAWNIFNSGYKLRN